jgi:hypothetical protein
VKKELIKNMVDTGSLVRLYVDTRKEGVQVPPGLRFLDCVCLDIGLPAALVAPIYDLAISDFGVQGTLSFSGTPFYCAVPYAAIFGVRHSASGGVVSWASAATTARGEASPPTERLPPKAEQTGAKVIDLAAWRNARGR